MIIHNFNDSRFPQSDKVQTIAGVIIPKGYVNASLMCKNYGKEIKRFMEIKSTKEYIAALEKDLNKMCGDLKSPQQETTKNAEEMTETVENIGYLKSPIQDNTKNTEEMTETVENIKSNVRSFKSTIQETTKNIEEMTETVEVWISSAISITSKNNVPNQYRGVWMHPELAIELAISDMENP